MPPKAKSVPARRLHDRVYRGSPAFSILYSLTARKLVTKQRVSASQGLATTRAEIMVEDLGQ
jgi:hypothetical protein